MLPTLPMPLDSAFPERTDLTDDQRAILALWTFGAFKNRYEEIAAVTQDPQWPWQPWSKGRIYHFVKREGVRVTEERIHERTTQRRERELAFLQEIMNTTVKCDVLDFLQGIPDDSVSCIITSPPYGIGKRYGGSASSDRMRHLFYEGWMLQTISEFARTLKPGGTMVFQSGLTFDDDDEPVWMDIMFYPAFRRAGLHPVNRIINVYDHGLFPKRRLAGRHETALVFHKDGTEQIFNKNAARTPALHPGKRRFKGENKGEIATHPLGSSPVDVWHFTAIKHNNPEKVDHPAQFPLEFARRCVMLYTNPGDLVLDPFSGSGTVQEACIRTGRAFVGADIAYEDVRAKRLADVTMDTVTPLPGVTEESMAIWAAEAQRRDVPATPITSEEDADMLLGLFGDQHDDDHQIAS
jgi:DNA modification methylase